MIYAVHSTIKHLSKWGHKGTYFQFFVPHGKQVKFQSKGWPSIRAQALNIITPCN